MTQPRSRLVCLDDTPWYHVVSRCVRRAFLCGYDAQSGCSFEHRRGWIADRLKQLASVFSVDIAAYAVMSNHFHIVLRVDATRLQHASRNEVLHRWTRLFNGPLLVQRYLADPGSLGDAELRALDTWVETYRDRLADLSWFMRVLNESIARQANEEDGVTGRFWEGRFRSQALLDEQAVLTAMTYVDLNPIRAGLAPTPESSDYTSIAERIAALNEHAEGAPQVPVVTEPQGGQAMGATSIGTAHGAGHNDSDDLERSPRLMESFKGQNTERRENPRLHHERVLQKLPSAPLMPFDGTGRFEQAIAFAFEDYLALVDATGRAIREDKRGFIDGAAPPLLDRLGIEPEQFITTASRMLRQFGSAIGTPSHISDLCVTRQMRYLRGMGAARKLYAKSAA